MAVPAAGEEMKPSPDQLARHKYFLRLHYRETVKDLSLAARRAGAMAVAKRLAKMPEFRRAETVGLFLSLPTEIDTAPLISLARREGKRVAIPVVFPEEGRLQFALLSPGKGRMNKNVYGILEPAHKEWLETLDLLVVPGSAFTATRDRLGAGVGYYDRFLARHPRLKTVGICFDEQISVRLPLAAHDRRVGAVVTPTHVYRGRRV